MTVDLITANTGIFKRFGKIFGAWKRVEQFQSDIIDNSGQSFQEAINEYINTLNATANTDLDMASSLLTDLDGLRNSIGVPVWNRLMQATERTLIEMVDADTKIPIRTVHEALIELRDQMDAADKTLDGSTITLGTPSVSGTGTGTVILSSEPDNTDHPKIAAMPTIRSETLTFKCVKDSSSDGVVSGGEIFDLMGKQRFPAGDHRWPGGTGSRRGIASTSDRLADGRVLTRNILRNSGFNSWTSNTPNRWRIATGSAGSHVYEETSTVARGTSCMKMASNGSTLIRVDQKLRAPGDGTPVKIHGDRLYAISLLARKGGTTSSAGSLRVGLSTEDGSIISGSTFNTAHGSISASGWTQLTYSFRAGGTTLTVPDPAYFMIQQSTAFTSGTNLFIDGVVIAQMYKTAPGGVACLIVPGATDWVKGDTITAAITNNGEGEMEKYLDRFFNLYDKGLFFPQDTGGSEDVADSLIA